MTDWNPRSQSTLSNDMSWLGSDMHVEKGIPIELNLALFDFVTAFPNGFLPSGIVLAKTGNVHGHYDPGTVVNESYSIVATGGTAGDFTLVFDGEVTAAIPWDSTAAAVEAALELLSNINAADVAVTGGPLPTTPVVVTFAGQYADQNLPDLVVGTENVTNGNAVVTPTQGGGAGAATGGAGLDVAKGHLLMPVSITDTFFAQHTTGVVTAALFTRGRVREAKLPTGHGLDAAAKAALTHIEYL